MAIEDGYQLALTLDQAVTSVQPGHTVNLEAALKSYAGVSPIHLRPSSLCVLRLALVHVLYLDPIYSEQRELSRRQSQVFSLSKQLVRTRPSAASVKYAAKCLQCICR